MPKARDGGIYPAVGVMARRFFHSAALTLHSGRNDRVVGRWRIAPLEAKENRQCTAVLLNCSAMRLSQSQRDCIRREAQRVFGTSARVRLFGSRVDDDRSGGDIDLHIEADGSPAALLDGELQLYAALQRQLGERRIDIIVHGRDTPLRAIDRHARQTGVPL